MVWVQILRPSGRWLMRGPRRRRIYESLNGIGRQALGTRIRSGPAAGLHFRGGDTIGYVLGVSEPALQRALSDHLHPGDVFYDVGAHAGFVTVLACRLVGPAGHVHCFEPVPANITSLRSNIDANAFQNATIHATALSDHDGSDRMRLTDRAITAHLAPEGDFIVRVSRCDSLALDPPAVVKIDVEGAESRVLDGMRQILDRQRPVVLVEVHHGQEAEVRRILEEFAYDITSLDEAGGMPHFLAIPRPSTP